MIAAGPPTGSIAGRWLTEKKDGVVEIFRCGADTMCGRLLWLRIPPDANDKAALDIRNPAPELRGRSLCGLVMMGGLKPAGKNEWRGGWLYDPASGRTYSGNAKLRPDGTLQLRGFVLLPLFGESQLWTRYTDPVLRCPAE